MYSIVMVAAMTASPEAPDFFFKNKGGGCYGCYGGGCYGSGCYGNGCFGSGWGFGGFKGGGSGCYGTAAVASSCYGCYGSGRGQFGFGGHAFVGSGCQGSQAYYTGCSGYYGPTGAWVPPPPGSYLPGYGGGVGVTGGATADPTGAGTTGAGTGTDTGGKGSGTGTGGKGGGPGAFNVPEAVPYLPAGRAQVVVRLPADAKLYADGIATTIGGSERVFLTPDISTARDYQYTLKVELPAGEPQTRQVVVRAGHRTVVEFTAPVAAAEKASSPVTVTLPAKARLFVDGVAAAADGGTHTFRTPELPKGKPYVYEFRAEVEKDGKTEVISRQVTFTAGEPVVLNFVEGEATRTASTK